MISQQFDIIIIGAGLVGLSVAYHMKKKQAHQRVLILEKEANISSHQSGHNSGVIHSGIYYKPRSLKAQNCINGYHALLDFAVEHDVKHEVCGKLIVAITAEEVNALDHIYERGIQNGLTNLKKLSKTDIREYEPYVSGIAAIHVPQTGIVDYPQMASKLLSLYRQLEGEILFQEEVVGLQEKSNEVIVETNKGTYSAKQLISCAGLQSDRVASFTEKENDLRILPFRGEYYTLKTERQHLVKNLIYPVPDPKFPFLGVHFTRMIHGGVEAGPNAVLAFKREGYKFRDFDFKDLSETLTWPGFWKVAAKYGKTGIGEIYRSLSKAAFTRALQKLVPAITEDDLEPGGAGVRAQACDKKGNLIDDFNILRKNNIIHVRNAPSPAATSCLAIGDAISGQLIN